MNTKFGRIQNSDGSCDFIFKMISANGNEHKILDQLQDGIMQELYFHCHGDLPDRWRDVREELPELETPVERFVRMEYVDPMELRAERDRYKAERDELIRLFNAYINTPKELRERQECAIDYEAKRMNEFINRIQEGK